MGKSTSVQYVCSVHCFVTDKISRCLLAVWAPCLHMALLPVRPDIPPDHYGDSHHLQAPAGQGDVPREESALLLEDEKGREAGEGAGGEGEAAS